MSISSIAGLAAGQHAAAVKPEGPPPPPPQGAIDKDGDRSGDKSGPGSPGSSGLVDVKA